MSGTGADPLKLLLVDDDPDIREIARIALGLDPLLEIRSVSDGEQALAMLDEPTWRPDCVLLDIRMPGLAGDAVLAEIRATHHLRTLPVILLTANIRGEDVQHYRRLGADDVIGKPFDPMSLAHQVRRILDRLEENPAGCLKRA